MTGCAAISLFTLMWWQVRVEPPDQLEVCAYLLLGQDSQGCFQVALIPHTVCKVVVDILQVLPGLLSRRSHSVQVLQDSYKF